MAQKLIGQFPNTKANEIFAAAVASAISEYPIGVVEDCINPRIGIARTVEWLSIEKIVSWCDARLTHHHVLANYRPAERSSAYAEGRIFTDEERLAASEFMKRLAAELAESARRKTQSGPREFKSPSDDQLRAMYAPRQEAAE